MDPQNNLNQLNPVDNPNPPAQAVPSPAPSPIIPSATAATGWFSGGKLIAIIVVVVLILGAGVYFAFFAKTPQTVNVASNKNVAMPNSAQDNSAKVTQQNSNENSPSSQSTNNSDNSLTGQIPSSCDNLISLDQVKNSVGDSSTMLSSSVINPDSNPSSSTAMVSCAYYNFDIKNPQTIKNPMIAVSLSVFNFLQGNWDVLKSNNGFNMTPVGNLGSQAFKYYNDKTLNIMPAYLVTSSNKKYIILIFVTNLTHPSDPTLYPTYDASKENQSELAIIKTVDANLNKY